MTTYLTDWFARTIQQDARIASARPEANGWVSLRRHSGPEVTVVPLGDVDHADVDLVEEVLEQGVPTVILVIPARAHYAWAARELAERQGSVVFNSRQFKGALNLEDPRQYTDPQVAYGTSRIRQQPGVDDLTMVCENLFEVRRTGHSPLLVAADYQYEFSEEALVEAIARHPDAQVIYNANPNGRPTTAASRYAKQVGIEVLGIGGLLRRIGRE